MDHEVTLFTSLLYASNHVGAPPPDAVGYYFETEEQRDRFNEAYNKMVEGRHLSRACTVFPGKKVFKVREIATLKPVNDRMLVDFTYYAPPR